MENRVTVSICGEEYTFVAEEAPSYMQKVGAYVGTKMDEMLTGAKVGRTDAAVLAAANIADELFKEREASEALRRQLKQYIDDAAQAKNEVSELKREVFRLQQKLDALHALNEALPDPELSAAMTRMEKAGRSIMETVEASPAKAKQIRRFANYYLPDAVNVLEQYAKLARQGVRGENAASIRAEVERNAASIATAFENQLDALYAAESMDLSADLTVLQNMLKGQGLG